MKIKLSHSGVTVLDNHLGETAYVRRNFDGTWYGDTGRFDFERKTEADMIATLRKWGFTTVAGYQSRR